MKAGERLEHYEEVVGYCGAGSSASPEKPFACKVWNSELLLVLFELGVD